MPSSIAAESAAGSADAESSVKTSVPLHKIRAVLLEGVHERGAELLSAAGYTVETHAGSLDGDELRAALREAHLVGIRSKTQLTAEVLASAPKLWAIGCFCIGTNQVDLDAASAQGVAVFNAPFSNTRSVAEKTLCEIIALHRRLFERSAMLHAGRWKKSAERAHEVRGRTLGVVGYGRIGSQISVLAEALGMNVVFYDPAPVLPLGNARSRSSLEQVLDEADVVTLHVPASATTAGMIGAAELQRMKPGSYLINNARGSVVDLEALREALTSGHLAGAAIDVYPEEPATRDAEYGSPLQELDNVILTPHIGGSTVEAQRAIAEEASGKLIRLMNDGSTAMSVNLPAVDLPTLHPDHHRIVHIHRNVPGVLGRLHSAVGDAGLNVAASYLQSDAATGYTILDVSRASDAPGDVPESMTGREKALLDALRAVPETIRVRSIW